VLLRFVPKIVFRVVSFRIEEWAKSLLSSEDEIFCVNNLSDTEAFDTCVRIGSLS